MTAEGNCRYFREGSGGGGSSGVGDGTSSLSHKLCNAQSLFCAYNSDIAKFGLNEKKREEREIERQREKAKSKMIEYRKTLLSSIELHFEHILSVF